jgi:hypothetical protein
MARTTAATALQHKTERQIIMGVYTRMMIETGAGKVDEKQDLRSSESVDSLAPPLGFAHPCHGFPRNLPSMSFIPSFHSL